MRGTWMGKWFTRKGGPLMQTSLSPVLPPALSREVLKLLGQRLQDPSLRDPNLLHRITQKLAQRVKHLVRGERTKSCYKR